MSAPRITVTAPRLFDDMSAHEQQQGDILDGQVQWWLEHGRTVGLLIFTAFLCVAAFLLVVLR